MDSVPRVPEAVALLKGLFEEMPGTRLTLAEAVRLSGLDFATCSTVLETLIAAHFLKQADGVFIRYSDTGGARRRLDWSRKDAGDV